MNPINVNRIPVKICWIKCYQLNEGMFSKETFSLPYMSLVWVCKIYVVGTHTAAIIPQILLWKILNIMYTKIFHMLGKKKMQTKSKTNMLDKI